MTLLGKTPKEAIILAGGLGTRLRSVVSDVPKPMAPVAGRPFLEHLIRYWAGQGIERFTLSVGHLAKKIEDHFGTSFGDTEIRYAREEHPLGTGGAIRLALGSHPWRSNEVMILNGDTWYEIALKQFASEAGAANLPISIAVKFMQENSRYGGIKLDAQGRVTEFGGIQAENCLVNGGIYLLDITRVFPLLDAKPEKFSFETDFMAQLSQKGQVFASIQNGRFLDIGVPDDFARAASFIKP